MLLHGDIRGQRLRHLYMSLGPGVGAANEAQGVMLRGEGAFKGEVMYVGVYLGFGLGCMGLCVCMYVSRCNPVSVCILSG